MCQFAIHIFCVIFGILESLQQFFVFYLRFGDVFILRIILFPSISKEKFAFASQHSSDVEFVYNDCILNDTGFVSNYEMNLIFFCLSIWAFLNPFIVFIIAILHVFEKLNIILSFITLAVRNHYLYIEVVIKMVLFGLLLIHQFPDNL